jgi:hypothetical protein
MRIRPVAVVTPLIGVALFLMAGAAGAVGQVTVSNPAPTPGSTIAVNSTGWIPGHAVEIALTGTNGILGRVDADASGSVHTHVSVPVDATLDTGVLSVTGTAASGVPQQIVTGLTIHRLGPASTPTRPWLAVILLAALAGALLLAGLNVAAPDHRLAAN